MKVLGINAFHGDSSAVLLKNGAFHAGIEEERLNRIKHWAGFPARAIETVLAMGGVTLEDVEHVAISRDPKAHLRSEEHTSELQSHSDLVCRLLLEKKKKKKKKSTQV